MGRLEEVTFERIPLTTRGGADGYAFNLSLWQPGGKPRAVVQLLHGMAEHIARYDRLARALCARGYAVAGHDHRGHGKNCAPDKLGYFYDEDGWDGVVEDAHFVSAMLRRRFPDTKIVLLGHSMGSFLAREYALRYGDELKALVLSGTGYYDKTLCTAGKLLARFSSPRKPAKFVDKIAFSSNNKPFEPARTAFDWLSRDEKEVDKYVADERCGFTFTGRAFYDFFGGLQALTKKERLEGLCKKLPIYLVSGDRDPVGGMGEGVKRVCEEYKKAGVQDVSMKLYEGARHEIFNEINRDEITDDLVGWLNRHCGEASQ